MSTPLWLAIQPHSSGIRLLLTEPVLGTALRARLPPLPKQTDGLALLLRGLSAWYGRALCAALDADAEDVRKHPERWHRLLGGLDDALFQVQWVSPTGIGSQRDRFFAPTGDFRSARRVVTTAATGLR